MGNRLAGETSPYLLQHQDNPVDWYPWGEEAFTRAAAEDKLVFLSVGYSSCHWCHVMAHESFEDEEVAQVLNEGFICVKVDREERPDVDEAYMTAVQLSSGRGGWPMSVFLTPDRKPVFAGTYFPKEDRGRQPGFRTMCRQLYAAWQQRRSELEAAADEFAQALGEARAQSLPSDGPLKAEDLDNLVRQLASDFDPVNAGFGPAPKFPPHSAIDFLLRYVERETAPLDLREAALTMSFATLERMALGGIHDHVGGGFHRYSTDGEWLLPHFEKMLYDNALLLGNFLRAGALAEEMNPGSGAICDRAARGIVDWLSREMTAPEGFFYSALDADSEGEEGKFYVWTEEEVRSVLGHRADDFLTAFGFKNEGNFRDEASGHLTGANIPHLDHDDGGRFAEALQALREVRSTRVRPGLDDKALVGWNGLMIGALARAGYLEMAARAGEAILWAESRHGGLPHHITKGQASGQAFLEDYAALADGLFWVGLLVAHVEASQGGGEVSGDGAAEFWFDHARRMADDMVAKFYDEKHGGFFGSSTDHEFLFGRTKPVFDQPIPSANALAIQVLLETGDDARASRSLEALSGWMRRAPHATEALHGVALAVVPDVASAPAPTKPKEVEVSLQKRELKADASGVVKGEVLIRIPEGLHLNSSQPPARWLTPTRVEVQPLKALVRYPPATEDRYVDEVTIHFSIVLPPGESGADLEVKVSYQACTESECQSPTEVRLSAVAYR